MMKLLLMLLLMSSAQAADKSLFVDQVPLDKRPTQSEPTAPDRSDLLDCERAENAEACQREPDPSEVQPDRPVSTIPIIPGVTINQPPVIR